MARDHLLFFETTNPLRLSHIAYITHVDPVSEAVPLRQGTTNLDLELIKALDHGFDLTVMSIILMNTAQSFPTTMTVLLQASEC